MATFSITADGQVAVGTNGPDAFNYEASVSAVLIEGLAGADLLDASSYTIGTSSTILMGGGPDTLIWGTAVDSEIRAGAGGDTVTFQEMSGSQLYLGAGSDSVAFSAVYSSTIFGGTGADTITQFESSYINRSEILLGAGADVVLFNEGGGAGMSEANIQLGGGADFFEFGGSAYSSTVAGGAGADTITFGEYMQDVLVQGGGNADLITLKGLDSGEDGEAYSSTIRGGAGADTIVSDFDVIDDVIVFGDAGSDSIEFNASSINSSQFWGGAGSDTIILNASGGHSDDNTVIGGAGADYIEIGTASNSEGFTNTYLGVGDSNVTSFDTVKFDSATTFAFEGIAASAMQDLVAGTFTTNSNAVVSFNAGAPADLEGRVALLDGELNRGESVLFDATADGSIGRFLFVQAGATSGSGIADDYVILTDVATELNSNGDNILTAIA